MEDWFAPLFILSILAFQAILIIFCVFKYQPKYLKDKPKVKPVRVRNVVKGPWEPLLPGQPDYKDPGPEYDAYRKDGWPDPRDP